MTEDEFEDGETSWMQLLVIGMMENHEGWPNTNWADQIEMVAVAGKLLTWEQAQTDKDFNKSFYKGFGCKEGAPFTAWSKDWVYFPVQYDGRESIGRAPRNPCNHANEHVGGG